MNLRTSIEKGALNIIDKRRAFSIDEARVQCRLEESFKPSICVRAGLVVVVARVGLFLYRIQRIKFRSNDYKLRFNVRK